jgi:hypothetical protein
MTLTIQINKRSLMRFKTLPSRKFEKLTTETPVQLFKTSITLEDAHQAAALSKRLKEQLACPVCYVHFREKVCSSISLK